MKQNKVTETFLNNRISYIKATENPLSADIGIIRGDDAYWLIDTGSSVETAEYVNSLKGKKNIILSHFHPDHTGNVKKINDRNVYLGKNTYKYIGEGEIIEDNVTIRDGVEIEIYPMPSSHAKGSLAVEVDKKIMFVGDALYAGTKKKSYGYNIQLLKAGIDIIKNCRSEYIFISHRPKPLQKKAVVLRWLEGIFENLKKCN